MIELIIKVTGEDLLNEKVDSIIQAVRQLQSSDGLVEIAKTEKKKEETKPSVADKKDEVKKPAVTEDKPKAEEEDTVDSLDTLRATAKAYFIKLAKKDRLKAKELLDNYGAESFTELSEIFKTDTVKWDSCLKLLMGYVG